MSKIAHNLMGFFFLKKWCTVLPILSPCVFGSKCYVLLSGTGFDEEAALLGAGREFALMKTASGKVRLVACLKCLTKMNVGTASAAELKSFCLANDRPGTLKGEPVVGEGLSCVSACLTALSPSYNLTFLQFITSVHS